MKKPFFWFLIKEPINFELLEEFKVNFAGNMGLAIADEISDATKYQIFDIFRAERQIPLAIYYTVEQHADFMLNPYFSISIFVVRNLKKRVIEPTYLCFRNTISLKGKININNVLNQLTPYFSCKSMFPESDAIIEFNYFHSSHLNLQFFQLMDKLDIHNYMVLFEKASVLGLRNYFKGMEELPINDKENDSKEMKHWRKQIDGLDDIIIETLHHRIRLVKEMGEYKKLHNLQLFQSERWQQIIDSKIKLAKGTNVDEEFLRKIFSVIHNDGLKKMIEMMDNMEFEE